MRRPIVLRVINGVVNPFVRTVLRSPVHRLASGSLLVLELVGARSGRALSLPVAYEQTSPSELLVHVGGPQHKLWWRNLRERKQVKVWLRGDQLTGTGLAQESHGAVEVLLRLDR